MRLKLPVSIYRLLKATSLWRDNYLILREFKHFRWFVIAAVTFSLVGALFEGFTIGLIAVFLRSLTQPDKVAFETGISWFDIWFLGVNASATSRLLRVSTLILIVIWLRSGIAYLSEVYTRLSELYLADRLKKQLFEQFQALSLSFFAQKRTGELLNSITVEIQQIRMAVVVASTFIAKGSIVLVYVASMLWLSWPLTIISILLFTLLAVGLSALIKRVREESFAAAKANRNFISVAIEFINGIRTVQAFATQDFERRRFYQASSEQVQAGTRSLTASALIQPLTQGVSTTAILILVVVATTGTVAGGNIPIASLLTFLFVLLRLAPIVTQLNRSWSQMSSYEGSLHDVKELLRRDNKTYIKNGKIQFAGLKQAIKFAAVDFAYAADNPVLHDIALTIKQGQMTALVGASGAGKTTLVDLIPRFYDPTRGQIFIDGVDLREFDIKSLRQKIAVVSQDTFIFNTSVWDNIAYGSEGADKAAIEEAARLANALEFIMKMPEGFDATLGDRGVKLSGGQRQRIAIARALLRNPEILILDEATSALDSVSERLIQKSLEQLYTGRTVIAIAHRLSTIVRADKVVVMEQGRIVEQGEYQELLQQRGKLWKYHQMQYEVSQVG